jgi:hypothetical protein
MYQTSVTFQHELRQGLGVTVSYNHTAWRNQAVIVNTALAPTDYTSFCVTAPTDSRLGSVSGSQVCGLYDANPAKFGQVSNVRMLAKDVPGAHGLPQYAFDGVDVALNARFRKGGLVLGGLALGRTLWDVCWMNNLPNVSQQFVPGPPADGNVPRSNPYCRVDPSWWNGNGAQIKFQVVYPLPYDFTVSGTYKNLPGVPDTSIYVYTNAQASGSLGRNLSACQGAVNCTVVGTVELLPAYNVTGDLAASRYDDRLNQFDARLSRTLRIGKVRAQPVAELYNIFNSRTPQGIAPAYGQTWLLPSALLGGRLFKFGAQIDF